MVHTNYFPGLADFDISWPGRVSRHDLVYQAPPSDPMQYGLPIGNGDLGVLVWCDDRKIILAINKCDLWDDFPGHAHTTNTVDEARTTLRHACRVTIDFGIPIFDSFYLKDFCARLRLKDGCVEFHTDTPLGSMNAEFFVGYDQSILLARVHTDFVEDIALNVTLERYGSRTYAYWYNYRKRNPEIGLSGTESYCKDGNIILQQQLSTGKFLCVLHPVGEGIKIRRRTSHMISAQASKCPKDFSFFLTVTSPLDPNSDEKQAISVLNFAAEAEFDAMLMHNEACWKAFWERSFIETDDDYLDNLWHLGLFYACCGQRGSYPGRFINSMWNWNRDVQPWNFYYHWNQQQTYWGLNAAGHHELCDSYLDFRMRGIPEAQNTAKERFGLDNALFVSDICDRNGKCAGDDESVLDNHMPVIEIALDFWRQYCYTCDIDFLKNKALPYMCGAARFAAACYVKEADGLYHAKSGSLYEGFDVMYDVASELTAARALFPAVLQALKDAEETDPDQMLWRDIAENIADYKLLEADERLLQTNGDNTYTLQRGVFQGRTVPSSKIISVGRFDRGFQPFHDGRRVNGELQVDYEAVTGKYVTHMLPSTGEAPSEVVDGFDIFSSILGGAPIPNDRAWGLSRPFSGHPQTSVSMVFPMSTLGLKDKDTDLFKAAITTAMTLHSHTASCNGWDILPIVLARLGLLEELDTFLYKFPSNWQFYNNGFTHYGPFPVFYADAHMKFRRSNVRDADNLAVTFRGDSFPFRHMGLEPLSVLMSALNERLLQSFDGVIRLIPTFGKRSAKFKLHAVGGFEVMAQIKEGVVEFVGVRSRFGKPLALINPWKEAFCDGKRFAEETIRMDTVAGETYLFTPDKELIFKSMPQKPADNAAPKVYTDGVTVLGLERSF